MNVSKGVRLLGLPESFTKFNSRMVSTRSNHIIEKRVLDTTKPTVYNPVTKRREFQIASVEYVIEERIGVASGYVLNWLSFKTHDHNVIVDEPDIAIMRRDYVAENIIPMGPNEGKVYWIGASQYDLKVVEGGCEITMKVNPFNNTFMLNGKTTEYYKNKYNVVYTGSTGDPEPTGGQNPLTQIERRDYLLRRKANSKETEIANPTSPFKSTILIDKLSLLSAMNCTEDELLDMRSTTYVCSNTFDSNKYIYFTCTDIEEVEENKLKGVFYINGDLYNPAIHKTMITSYMKTYPGHVQSWRMYNGVEKVAGGVNTFDATFANRMTASEDNTLTVLPTDTASWVAEDKTFRYNENYPFYLWFQIQELPAQGKNWVTETYRYVQLGINTINPFKF